MPKVTPMRMPPAWLHAFHSSSLCVYLIAMGCEITKKYEKNRKVDYFYDWEN